MQSVVVNVPNTLPKVGAGPVVRHHGDEVYDADGNGKLDQLELICKKYDTDGVRGHGQH